MSSTIATGNWSLGIQDPRFGRVRMKAEDVTGRTTDELLQRLWERFGVREMWDQELIAHGLSSPSHFNQLQFYTSISCCYIIATEIPDREVVFPRKPATLQDAYGEVCKVEFTDSDFDKKHLRSFGFSELHFQRESFPEIVALYHSNTFTTHYQASGDYSWLSRTFKKV